MTIHVSVFYVPPLEMHYISFLFYAINIQVKFKTQETKEKRGVIVDL